MSELSILPDLLLPDLATVPDLAALPEGERQSALERFRPLLRPPQDTAALWEP